MKPPAEVQGVRPVAGLHEPPAAGLGAANVGLEVRLPSCMIPAQLHLTARSDRMDGRSLSDMGYCGEPEIGMSGIGQHVIETLLAANRPPLEAGVYYASNFDSKRRRIERAIPLAQNLARRSATDPTALPSYRELSELLRMETSDTVTAALAIEQAQKIADQLPGILGAWAKVDLNGYADPAFWRSTGFMRWTLLPGKSAAQGIKAWLRGPTIAECGVALQVSQLESIRAALGDTKFDRMNSGAPFTISDSPSHRLLHLSPYASQKGSRGRRNVELGEWCQFRNLAHYEYKHPAGYWRQENVCYAGMRGGQQFWVGLGFEGTEEQIIKHFVDAYNEPRTDDDRTAIAQIRTQDRSWGKRADGVPDKITEAEFGNNDGHFFHYAVVHRAQLD